MSRVLHVISGLSTGGAERALYNLLRGGLAAAFDNHVVSLTGEGSFSPRIRPHCAELTNLDLRPAAAAAAAGGIFRLRALIRRSRPQLIQGWMYHGNLAATMARSAHPEARLVWNIRHSIDDLKREKPALRIAIRAGRLMSRQPAVILYNSLAAREQHERLGYAARAARVIPNGIDTVRFARSAAARARIRAQLGLPETALVIGHVARFHPMKNHRDFVSAAVELASTRPALHVVMAGARVTGDNVALAGLVPESLRPRFVLLGETSRVSELMSGLDIFCLSSAWGEGFPNAVGEAMASSLPSVATNVGDTAQIVGDTGIVVAPRDREALRDGLRTLIEMPAEQRAALGERARERIETAFALPAVGSTYVALYRELLS